MELGSLVHAVRRNVDMSVFPAVAGSMEWIQHEGAKIFAAVSSRQACAGTPSSSRLTLNLKDKLLAWASRVHGRKTRKVPPAGRGERARMRSLVSLE
jgi:hypothetical protein